ncbi:amino acid/amide ABC transporter substrate-binding protein (HAAT family) [Leucobacter luti]|uniref:branched-chain amino acid ABC transporter substrate-binding protein n=1 Tax=Leucobacter luti TaxID=340320 RepID=UPI0010484C61|nr:branched-chain amino acid ABC transporter substrate-binding protein [Leucobacter luti]MCW2287184.1 branched-chain amino acid transport system substrate-binding protein [Leucobacter luti]TCK41410.1 amino acid/amide ABC transporter substrate-binding protein (HAAT family) [Leucobacter luti]
MPAPHTRWTQRIATVGVLAATAALVLSGCSGGVAGSGDSGSTDGPIKLGMLAPFSGSEAAFGDYMKNGAQLAVDEINADGGVDGRDLELVVEDDACDATASVAAAQKLVTAGISVSVGGYCSGATLPTLPIFMEAGISVVIPAANSNALVGQGAFLINGTGAQQAGATVKYINKVGAKSVAVIDDNTDYSKDLANSVIDQSKTDGDFEIVKTDSVNPDEKDFAANVNNVLGANPDFVVWTGYYQAGGLLVRQLREAGYDGPILVGDGSVDAQLAAIAGAEFVDNVVGTFTQTPDMLEGADTWIADYTETFGEAPGPYSTQSYDAVRVAAEAITQAGSTDADAVTAALAAFDGFPLFSGPATFADDGTLEGSGGFVIVEPTGDDGAFVMKDNLQE